MERVPIVGVPVYTRIDADRVKRQRIVEDVVILRGSAGCLEKQIEAAASQLQTAQKEHDACIDCACLPCLTRAEELLTEIETALETETELKAEWKRATNGKEFPIS